MKRVYQMHEVLGLVDLSSDSSSSLREHLKAASVSLLYLKTEEVRLCVCPRYLKAERYVSLCLSYTLKLRGTSLCVCPLP